MKRPYNFSAGPSTLPEEVLQQAQSELLNWQGLGLSVMEISHHSSEFKELIGTIETNLRQLLNVPSNYRVLFLQGGGRSQFSMVPLNLLGNKTAADYIDIGIWSKLAITEASRYCKVNVVASSAAQNYTTIPSLEEWRCNPEAAFFYYVANETVNGLEFPEIPNITDVPLVSDMSSNLLSRVIDVSRFGLIFAAAQKNIGIAGITLVIVREDLLGNALPITPMMFNYKTHADANSLYNTPPTFAWYLMGLVLQWIKGQGGIAALEATNQRKAEKFYTFLDATHFYRNSINPLYRSRMNVVFRLIDENLSDLFLQEAKRANLVGLKGHKMIGGMRASIYNAMPKKGVDALISFMKEFEKKYG